MVRIGQAPPADLAHNPVMGLMRWIRRRRWANAAVAFALECVPLISLLFVLDLTQTTIGWIVALGLLTGLGWWFVGEPLTGFAFGIGRFLVLLAGLVPLLIVVVADSLECLDASTPHCESAITPFASATYGLLFAGTALLSAGLVAPSAFRLPQPYKGVQTDD